MLSGTVDGGSGGLRGVAAAARLPAGRVRAAPFREAGAGGPAAVELPWQEQTCDARGGSAPGPDRRLMRRGPVGRFDPAARRWCGRAAAGHGGPAPAGAHQPPHHLGRLVDGPRCEICAPVRGGRRRGFAAAGRPVRTYLGWLSAQDEASLAAWGEALAGLEEPTLVAPGAGRDPGGPAGPARADSLADDHRRHRVGRARGLTVNTLLRAPGRCCCPTLTRRQDVVFGATVSGRPPELPGVDQFVGC